MIAVTFALRAESSAFVARLRGLPPTNDVVVVHTGVGRAHCQLEIEKLLSGTRPTFLISSGFAGAVTDQLQTGEVIIGKNFSDPELVATASRILGHEARAANLATADAIVDSVAERRQIARTDRADAVDMETKLIAEACARRNVPMLSLRVVSDDLQHPLPVPPPVLFNVARQKTDFVRLIGYLLVRPAAIPRLMRFSRQIQHARNNLADALVKLLSGSL